MSDEVYITVDKRNIDGALQVAISCHNGGHGYRIAGPKYDGHSKTLLSHKLTARDVVEIRGFLNRVSADAKT